MIIKRTIGLVLGPCTALYSLVHCTLTNKAVGTMWQALSKPPQRRQGPDLRLLWLLVGTPSAIRPELAFSRAEHSLPYSDVTIYRTLQRVRLANRGRLLLRTPGPVPFGTCICSNVETILSELVMSTDLLSFEHPSVLLFCFCYIIFIIYALLGIDFMTSPLGVAVGLLSI